MNAFRPLMLVSLAAAPMYATVSGTWDAQIQYDAHRIPFLFELTETPDGTGAANVTASFFNGDDKVTSTGGRLNGNALSVNFDHYATRLTATVEHGVIHGTYGNTRNGFHDFEARPHAAVTAAAESKAPDISGVWDLPTESSKGEHAWRLIVRQSGAKASAAILRVDGDTGLLEGRYHDGQFDLNHFDGARAAILTIKPLPDGRLDVDEPALGKFPGKHFTAVRLDEAKAKGLPEPTDPEGHTRVKHPDQPFAFAAPDLTGHAVSSTDERFRNKVVIVNVTGSWCPNCHDEAPFLAELYRKYHGQGLEVVALDFEEAEQLHDPARLRAFINKYKIEYPYLLVGEPAELAAKIPEAENLNSWPTTFFLGRDGTVRAIHAGFAAAASGPYHDELVRETTERVEKLLAENHRASR